MKEKIISLMLKYLPKLAKLIWPHLKKSVMRNEVPEIIAFRNESGNNNVLVFIHGFSGDAATTFGSIPTYLMNENKMNGWNIYSVGYSTDAMPAIGIGIWAAAPDITKLSNFLITQIKSQFKNYKRIAIIAHSMGGLVTQKALVDIDTEHRNRITDIILYGTPSTGLVKARLAKWWNRQLRDMSKDGEFITELRNKWKQVFPTTYPFTFKVVAGTDDEFVPIANSQSCFDETYCEVVSGNHLTIVKPNDVNHAGYQLLLSTIVKTPFNNEHADAAAINLMLGKYNDVVNELNPSADKIDSNGTTKLVFALEGLGRKDEGRTVLENYIKRDSKKNTDILGILGGRYKRYYLDGYKTDDGEKAIAYYSEAFEEAKSKNDYPQIFYHAVNLAFLNLVFKHDAAEMEKYATETSNAAEKSPTEKWQQAALADAAVYKRNLDAAKTYYSVAASSANLREKDSMYTNAYFAYSTLYNTENDDFIKFLRTTFLS
jgi:pimeloyl-ACP methyl ester carboxylesterase